MVHRGDYPFGRLEQHFEVGVVVRLECVSIRYLQNDGPPKAFSIIQIELMRL